MISRSPGEAFPASLTAWPRWSKNSVAGGSAVGEVQVGHREIRVLGDRPEHELARLVGPQVLRERPSLEVVGLRFGGGGADWNLAGRMRRLRGDGRDGRDQRGERERRETPRPGGEMGHGASPGRGASILYPGFPRKRFRRCEPASTRDRRTRARWSVRRTPAGPWPDPSSHTRRAGCAPRCRCRRRRGRAPAGPPARTRGRGG